MESAVDCVENAFKECEKYENWNLFPVKQKVLRNLACNMRADRAYEFLSTFTCNTENEQKFISNLIDSFYTGVNDDRKRTKTTEASNQMH